MTQSRDGRLFQAERAIVESISAIKKARSGFRTGYNYDLKEIYGFMKKLLKRLFYLSRLKGFRDLPVS